MAMQPIDFTIGGPDAGLSFMAGRDKGQQLAAQRAQAIADRDAKLQKRLDFAQLMKDQSAQGFAEYTLKYPEDREAAKQSFDMLDDERKQSVISFGSQVFSAIQAGDVDLAKSLADERLAALKNSGASQRDIAGAEMVRKSLDASPAATSLMLATGLAAAVGPEKFAETFSKLEDERRKREGEATGKTADELALEKTRAEIAKTKAETDRIIKEANEAKTVGGSLKPEDYVKTSTALSDEYRKSVKGVPEMATAYTQLQALYEVADKDPSGASDIPFLTQFMKTLDSGSTVRESEFATAQGAGGLYQQLANTLDSATKGTKVTAAVRKKFMESAKALYNAAQKTDQIAKNRVGALARKVGIDPNDVFSALPGQEESAAAPMPQTQADYDALPSGTVYIDPDDKKQYRKP